MEGRLVSPRVAAAIAAAALAASTYSNATTLKPQTVPSGLEAAPILPEATADAARATLERRVELFVRAITRSPGSPDDNSAARWRAPICLLVVGMNFRDVNLVSNRISQISSFAGAPLARTPCQPNFIVVWTASPDQILNAWYARNKQLFGDATTAQIRQFLDGSQSRPVRVWYNIDRGRKAGLRNGHFVPSSTQAESSVFLGNEAADFLSVFAIIDTHHTDHVTLYQLADYVAMSGLTAVDPGADLDGAPSILRLFSVTQDTSPAAISPWDTAFLSALYRSNPASRTQRFEIEQRVMKDILR